ncbi:hypothetical protein FZC76_18330 [Sutcliffiella horikoshii]|uniref:Uncharacterized protein n=1 Tax=Sutcliffiella horikoshii TaxID=79883 RepID=A0A5D4SNA2_9BACI|nr:hypothetical protein [Sutcliffiella horikoshii]TYS64519.1 hypothetical protein FZC76_18330 [Sutcliffiella horikoshii]
MMEMYDYIMLMNLLAIVSTTLVSYMYVSQMVMRKGAFFFHTAISLSFIILTWFTTTTIWYFLTLKGDGLLYIGGMLFNMMVAIFCSTVFLAYLFVQRAYFIRKYKRNKQTIQKD